MILKWNSIFDYEMKNEMWDDINMTKKDLKLCKCMADVLNIRQYFCLFSQERLLTIKVLIDLQFVLQTKIQSYNCAA